MKRTFPRLTRFLVPALILFNAFLYKANGQDLYKSKQIALKVFSEIRKNSLYKNNVSWDTVSKTFLSRVDTARTEENQFKQFRWLFSKLNDFHSAVYYKNKPYQVIKPTPQGRDKEFKVLFDAVSSNNKKIEVELLENKLAYILIPAANVLDSVSIDSLSRVWRKVICEKLNDDVRGYILDLRLNMGGNIYPMLAAISYLLGDGKVAGSTDKKGAESNWWKLKSGDVFFDKTKITFLGKHCLGNKANLPVAVLTSYFTISSGEILNTAFKNRPNTIQIGDTTGGLITNNHYYKIADETYLNLSVGYFEDRKKTVYTTGIAPDIFIRGEDDFTNKLNDKKVLSAIKWINATYAAK